MMEFLDTLRIFTDWFSKLETGYKIAILGIIIASIIGIFSIIVAILAWRFPKKSKGKTLQKQVQKQVNNKGNNIINNDNSSGKTINHYYGIDPEKYAKVLAKVERLEEQIKQSAIASVSDDGEIKQLIERGKYAEAEKLALAKTNDLLLLRLAYLQGKYQNAIRRGELLLSAGYRNDAEVYFMLGFAYADKGEYDKAIQVFEKVLRIDPNDAMAHYNLGLAYADKGEHDKAIQVFEKVLRIDPNNAKVKVALEELKKLKPQRMKAQQ